MTKKEASPSTRGYNGRLEYTTCLRNDNKLEVSISDGRNFIFDLNNRTVSGSERAVWPEDFTPIRHNTFYVGRKATGGFIAVSKEDKFDGYEAACEKAKEYTDVGRRFGRSPRFQGIVLLPIAIAEDQATPIVMREFV